jgi:superfamily II DNA helicase RecQ
MIGLMDQALRTRSTIPDIQVAVIYRVDSFMSFVQKGGRAGRDGKIEAKMVWLVEDWMFEEGGGKRDQERRSKVDPTASKYILRQKTGSCLCKFMNQVLQPDPRHLISLDSVNKSPPDCVAPG